MPTPDGSEEAAVGDVAADVEGGTASAPPTDVDGGAPGEPDDTEDQPTAEPQQADADAGADEPGSVEFADAYVGADAEGREESATEEPVDLPLGVAAGRPDAVATETPGAAAPDSGAEFIGAESVTDEDEAADRPALSDSELRGALEAILLVVDEPVTEMTLAQVLGEPTDRVSAALHALADDYATGGRGFEARSAAGGWRLYTRAEFAPYVERFVLDGQQIRLTQAALETLAVVAYKQPVTRSRISAIRGVNCDGVIKTLVARGLVEECGAEPESGAFLYRTTSLFLEKLGINGVEELPPLAPFLPDNVDDFDGQH
jgi:segregation and condensation protein B